MLQGFDRGYPLLSQLLNMNLSSRAFLLIHDITSDSLDENLVLDIVVL